MILKDHKIDVQRFYYAGNYIETYIFLLWFLILFFCFIGALRPNNKMDSDVFLAEFLVYDALETLPNAELKKVNLSHMQRNKNATVSDDTLASIVTCVSQCQSYIVTNGKFPRFRNTITPTVPPKKKPRTKKSAPSEEEIPVPDTSAKNKM